MYRFFSWLTHSLRLLHGWRAILLCFVSGALTALAFAPYEYWFLLPVTLPVFYLLLEAAPARRHGWWRGFFFGYGYFMAGTYWIANALLVDAAQFGWLYPISIAGLSAVMALWFGVFGWLFWWRRSGAPFADLLRFIVLWVLVEYLRTLGIFGFPWNLLGYAAFASQAVVQLSSLVGTFGLSLLVLLLALLPVVWLRHGISEQARMVYTASSLIALIMAYGYGVARVPSEVALTETRLRVVQPNIPQNQKWTQAGRLESLKLHAQLSRMQSEAGVPPTILIWSETAMPFTVFDDSPWPSRLAELIPPRGMLLTGAVRADDRGSSLKLWNSMLAIDAAGTLRRSYDKHQLVPFGEFVPLRNLLPLQKITNGGSDFERGSGPQTLALDDLPPFSPLICYEVIFPWLAVDPHARPEWLLNVTNDAWYGDAPGPYQHYAMTRMRAIEQGLPIVRAANTGISAVIDPYGQPVRYLPLQTRGIIDQALPRPIAAPLYARFGEVPCLGMLLTLWLLSFYLMRVKKS